MLSGIKRPNLSIASILRYFIFISVSTQPSCRQSLRHQSLKTQGTSTLEWIIQIEPNRSWCNRLSQIKALAQNQNLKTLQSSWSFDGMNQSHRCGSIAATNACLIEIAQSSSLLQSIRHKPSRPTLSDGEFPPLKKARPKSQTPIAAKYSMDMALAINSFGNRESLSQSLQMKILPR